MTPGCTIGDEYYYWFIIKILSIYNTNFNSIIIFYSRKKYSA
jgi:hypothetical protein